MSFYVAQRRATAHFEALVELYKIYFACPGLATTPDLIQGRLDEIAAQEWAKMAEFQFFRRKSIGIRLRNKLLQ